MTEVIDEGPLDGMGFAPPSFFVRPPDDLEDVVVFLYCCGCKLINLQVFCFDL